MSSANQSLLSGRAQDRISQLQRELITEQRALSSKQSLLFGALQACDLNTQSSLLREYFAHVDTMCKAVLRLRALIERHLPEPLSQATDREDAGQWLTGSAAEVAVEGGELERRR